MKKCESCCNYRQEDGCRWCDKGILPNEGCKAYAKRLTPTEIERVTELQQVWEYLYSHKAYELCDTISLEIGYIKGKCKEDIL